MKAKVLAFGTLPKTQLQRLGQEYDLADFTGQPVGAGNVEFMARLAEAEGLIGSFLKFDRGLIAQARKLRVISSVTVGYDNYDVDALSARGILLCNTPDVLTDSVADIGMALVLMLARRLLEMAAMVRAGEWTASLTPSQYGSDVRGRSLGIIGMGRIGAAIAQRAQQGFGMRVLYHSRSRKPDAEAAYAARYCSLDELLAQADFVCLALPLSPDTRQLIGAREFALMRKEAFFVNISRGAIVDEPSLISALQSGQIAGAGLDVFATEPLPMDSPLMRLPNVVALPHLGSATQATREAMAALAVDNLFEALAGRMPRYPVNPQVFKPAG